MYLRFNASGRTVWDVATAVAWRIDPDRKLVSEFVKDPNINTDVERVFVEHVDTIGTPPRLRKQIEGLRSRFPDAITEIMRFIVAEHIYAALNSDIADAVQNPDRAPFLVIGESPSEASIYVDIDAMLKEYHEASTQIANWKRQEEEVIKHVVRNSVTPRFDKVDVRLEDISRKLDAGFNATASAFNATASASDIKGVNQRLDQLIEEIRKSKPPQP